MEEENFENRLTDAELARRATERTLEGLDSETIDRLCELRASGKIQAEQFVASVAASISAVQLTVDSLERLVVTYSTQGSEEHRAFLDAARVAIDVIRGISVDQSLTGSQRVEVARLVSDALGHLADVEKHKNEQRSGVVRMALGVAGAVALGAMALIAKLSDHDDV